MRYTERHGGVAVIKDKSKHKDAMEKLAKVEDMEEKNMDMDKLTTTEMMEHICDHLCKHPCNAKDQEELEDICAECKMGKYVCDILNTYNRQMQQTMSDYISKNALIEQLIEWANRNEMMGYLTSLDIVRECIGVVENQATVNEKEIIRKAFKRVVERLQEEQKGYICDEDDYCEGAYNAYRDVIQVVKGRGWD